MSVAVLLLDCQCIYQTIIAGIQTGKKLSLLESDCRIFGTQMKECGLTNTLTLTICCWLPIVQLMGKEELLLPIAGINSDHRLEDLLALHREDNTISAKINTMRSLLYAIFGEHEKGANLAIEKGDSWAKASPGHFWIMIDTFYRAIALYAWARQTKLRRYKKHAKQLHETIKKWGRIGVPSVGHYEKILNAESSLLKGDFDAAEGWYRAGLVLASKSGFLADAAIANERLGELLLNHRNDTTSALYQIDEAHRLYVQWGADKKAKMLLTKYEKLRPRPTEIVVEP